MTSSYRRHAAQTASLWHGRLKDASTPKRLNLIYLANEVVQQSRARNKSDFLTAFEPLISDATAMAYKGASRDVQNKLTRVVEVWRQRNIFNTNIQDAIEQRLEELDRARSGKGAGLGSSKLGGNLFGGAGGIPSALEPVAKSQTKLSKADSSTKPALNRANEEYDRLTDPSTPVPSAPIRAAQLNRLMKNLAEAQGAVETSLIARRELLAGLETLIETNRAKLASEEQTFDEMKRKWDETDLKRKEVEDAIMLGASASDSPAMSSSQGQNGRHEMQAPETEGFTPPPPEVESFASPPAHPEVLDVTHSASMNGVEGSSGPAVDPTAGYDDVLDGKPDSGQLTLSAAPQPRVFQDPAGMADDFLASLTLPGPESGVTRHTSSSQASDPRLKRRKLNHGDEALDDQIFGNGVGGVDEEGINALLGS